MVIPRFDLMSIFGVAQCPTCDDSKMVYTVTGTFCTKTEEEICREKLYGELEE